MAAVDVESLPFSKGERDAFIQDRVAAMAAAIGEPGLASRFPHLGTACWRKRPDMAAVQLARFIDHTVLKPATTAAAVSKLTAEAREHGFCAVCVNGSRAAQAIAELRGAAPPVAVAAVVGFPLGAATAAAKAAETRELVAMGVAEIDMVMNVGAMKDGDHAAVHADVLAVVAAAGSAAVKVILEVCLLTEQEIVDASILAVAAGARFIKTSTGFSTGGATPEAVAAMLAVAGNVALVKASGGVSNPAAAAAYVAAGVSRIGTSSGVAIVTGQAASVGY